MTDAPRRSTSERLDPLRPVAVLSHRAGAPAVVTAMLCVLAVLWFGLAVARSTDWRRAELRLLASVVPEHAPLPDAIALGIDAAFDPVPALGLTIVTTIVTAAITRDLARAATFALTVLIGWRTGELVKLLVQRPRPDVLVAEHSHAELVSTFAYPSGHAGFAVAFSLGILLLARDRRPLLTVAICGAFVALVAYSRMYLGLHHLTDVLAGALLAAAIGALFLAWWLPHAAPVLSAAAPWLRPAKWRL